MEEDFTEESSDGTLVRGDDHSYDAHKFPVLRGHSNTELTALIFNFNRTYFHTNGGHRSCVCNK